MGIWKWMKTAKYYRRVPVFVLVAVFSSAGLSAETSFGLRLMSLYYFPLNDPLFKTPSLGGTAVLDCMLLPNFGFFAQGELVSLGLKNVTAVPLYDGSLGAGFIWRPLDRISLRTDVMTGLYSAKLPLGTVTGISGGARVSAEYHISPVLSASILGSYRYYSYTPQPTLSALSVGLGLTINLTEAFSKKTNITTEKVSEDPVFPVLYSWYDENKFGVMKVTNNEETAITDITASFYLEQYMGQPKVCMTVAGLAPGASVEFPLKGFFNETMLELTEKIDTQAKVIVEYQKLGSKRKSENPVLLPVYNRNSMSWDDDRRAAAFVSSKDPAAMWFSKYVSGIVRDRFRKGINGNIQYAMGVFESLNAYGLNYVIDPTSSYADNAGSGASIDFLQFPYQTLMYRGGDCDDLSILFCSLLEAIGIDSAFITIPGHIFMAFSSGMTEEEARANFYAPEQLIYKDGKAWVPLEITLTKEGFSKAWRIGAKEWNDADARGKANLYPMQDSWKIYKPVSVPGAASRFNLPDEAKTAKVFDASLNVYVEREIRPQIRACEASIALSDTPAHRNTLGVLYGKYGMLEQSNEQFSLAAKKGYLPAWTNLGNIAFMEKNYTDALTYYNYAVSMNADDTIALLGSARCYYELEEFTNSDSLYTALGTKDAVLGRQYAYLGSFFETKGRAWSLSDRLSTTTWNLGTVNAVAASKPAAVPAPRLEPVVPPMAAPVPVVKTVLEASPVQNVLPIPAPAALPVQKKETPAPESAVLPVEEIKIAAPAQTTVKKTGNETEGAPEKISAVPVAETIEAQAPAVVTVPAAPVPAAVAATAVAVVPAAEIVAASAAAAALEPAPAVLAPAAAAPVEPAPAVQTAPEPKAVTGGLSSMLSIMKAAAPETTVIKKTVVVQKAPPVLPPALPAAPVLPAVLALPAADIKPAVISAEKPVADIERPTQSAVITEKPAAVVEKPAAVAEVSAVQATLTVEVKPSEKAEQAVVEEVSKPQEAAPEINPVESVQINPKEIKKIVRDNVAASEVQEAVPVDASYAHDSASPSLPVKEKSPVPIAAVLLAGLTAAGAGLAVRFRLKRKNLNKRNKS